MAQKHSKKSTSFINSAEAQRYLAQVPEDKVFWCHDNCIFRDLRELQEGLADMPPETFNYHSNETKHDFSHWIREVVGDKELARELETAANPKQAADLVEQRMGFLKLEAAKGQSYLPRR